MPPIILGGVSRAGKTTLSRQLHHATGLSLLSGDALMSAFGDAFPELEMRHGGDFEQNCKKFAPFAAYFLKVTYGWEQIPFIFNSVYILPEQVIAHKLHEKCRILFLGYPDIDPQQKLYDIRNFKTEGSDWTDSQTDAEMLPQIEDFIATSRRIRDQCEKYALDFIDVSRDFTGKMQQAFVQLTT